MSGTPNKKERGSNFTDGEITLLVELAIKHSNTIECAKSDAVTWKQKVKVWEQLTAEFNSASGHLPRTTKSLKSKYDGVKKDLRKKKAANRQQIFITGGGTPDLTPLTTWEEKLLEIILLSCEGLPATNDCDTESETVMVLEVLNDNQSNINLAPASRNTSTVSLQLSGHDSAAVATTSITDEVQVTTAPTRQSDWSQWPPAQLKQPKSKPFRKSATLCDTYSINGLAAAKMDLAKFQAALVAAEKTHKEAEHTIKIKNLTSENNLKMLLLGEELKLKKIQTEVQAEILEGLKLDNKNKRQDLLQSCNVLF